MASPLNALVSQVLNNVRTGLHGKVDISISEQQVITELLQGRAQLVKQYQLKGVRISKTSLTQELPLIPVNTIDPRADWRTGLLDERLAALGLPLERPIQVAPLPTLLTDATGEPLVDFLGSLDEQVELKVLFGTQKRYARHDRLTGKWPTITLQEQGGELNACCPAWPFIMGRVALFDPRQSSDYGKLFDPDTTPGPWPDFIEEEMVRNLTNKYVSQYGRYAKTPDTGPDSPL